MPRCARGEDCEGRRALVLRAPLPQGPSPRRPQRACGARSRKARGGADGALPRQHRFPCECAAACATDPRRPPSSSVAPGLSRRLHPSAATLHADRNSTVRESRRPCAFPTWAPSEPCMFPPCEPFGPCPHPAPIQLVFAGSPPGGFQAPLPRILPVPAPAPFACYSPQKHAARVAHAIPHSYNQIADSIYYWLASNNGSGRKEFDDGHQSIEAVGGAVNVISRRGANVSRQGSLRGWRTAERRNAQTSGRGENRGPIN